MTTVAGTKVRTSFTLDRGLFERAERFSKRLHVSRSEFFERAVEDYVTLLVAEELREHIDAAQASLSEGEQAEARTVTEFLQHATARTLKTTGPDEW
jgi:metal-responsive CopG/Arc/MetJ family transcriptional regulator